MPATYSEIDRRLEAVTKVAQAMATTGDYERALAGLIQTVSELLDVETGGFLLYDADRQELVLQEPAFGLHDRRIIEKYHVSPYSGGNAVAVFLSREPYLTNDARGDPRLIHRFVDMFGAHNVLSVPLVVEERCIGVFHAINKRGDFETGDLELLSLLAPILAVSIQSAQMFRDMQQARRQLERAMYLQNELSRTALDAHGIEALAARLAELLGRPVMVVDADFQPLAEANWQRGVIPDDSWVACGSQIGGGATVLAPIAVGQHFGGHVVVLEDGRPFDVIEERAIQQAATVFALEMLRERSAHEAELRAKGSLVRDLLSGIWGDETEAEGILRRLDYALGGPWRVARLDATGTERSVNSGREPIQGQDHRLYRSFRQACHEVLGVGAVCPWRTGLLAVVPSSPDDGTHDERVALELLACVGEHCRAIQPSIRLHLTVGSCVTTATNLARSAEEAERAMIVARRLSVTDRPLFYEHLGVYRLLVGPNDAIQQRQFVHEILGPLLHHDAQHGSDLVSTLRHWVSADHNVQTAARHLFVHPNTVKYRLRQIRNLIGGDPASGDIRLNVELALKILDLPRLELGEAGRLGN